jgi:hypothetical protein
MVNVRHHVIYCDDVRDEVGLKTSYMGVYGPELIIRNATKAILPKLCAVAFLKFDGMPPSRKIEVSVYRETDGQRETIGEVTLVNLPEEIPDDVTDLTITPTMVLGNTEINGPCEIGVLVEAADQKIYLDQLQVRFAQSDTK